MIMQEQMEMSGLKIMPSLPLQWNSTSTLMSLAQTRVVCPGTQVVHCGTPLPTSIIVSV